MSSDLEQANSTDTPVNNASDSFNKVFRRFLQRQNLQGMLQILDRDENSEEGVENPVAEPGLDLAQIHRTFPVLIINNRSNQTLTLIPSDDSPFGTRSDLWDDFLFDFRGRGSVKVDSLLSSLPTVETASLPEDDQSCPVCREEYDTPSAAETRSEEAPETEPAIRLRCNHVLGKSCLKTWLESGNTTCPFCRANVYAPQILETTRPPPPT